jgi:hypothetical protein
VHNQSNPPGQGPSQLPTNVPTDRPDVTEPAAESTPAFIKQDVKDEAKDFESKQLTSARPASRAEGELLAQRQRMLLQAQTKAMLQGVPSSGYSGQSNSMSSYEGGPSSQAGPSSGQAYGKGALSNGTNHDKESLGADAVIGKYTRS